MTPFSAISIQSRRKRQETRTHSVVTGANGNIEEHEVVTMPDGEVCEFILEHVANPSAEQVVAWDAFWQALIRDLRPLVMERVKAKAA